MPSEVAPCFAGAPLIQLRKSDNGIRPIAVGETFRRLVSSMQMKRVELRERELLQPLQGGVATPGECEAIVHAARHVTH